MLTTFVCRHYWQTIFRAQVRYLKRILARARRPRSQIGRGLCTGGGVRARRTGGGNIRDAGCWSLSGVDSAAESRVPEPGQCYCKARGLDRQARHTRPRGMVVARPEGAARSPRRPPSRCCLRRLVREGRWTRVWV